MKKRETHIVPLSKQAIEIINRLKNISTISPYLFPNIRNSKKCMSKNTLLVALYKMGYQSKTTTHGFRSTASTILNENGFRCEVIEYQLAHAERNKVSASNNHTNYMADRITMMQWWADYVDKQRLNYNSLNVKMG